MPNQKDFIRHHRDVSVSGRKQYGDDGEQNGTERCTKKAMT